MKIITKPINELIKDHVDLCELFEKVDEAMSSLYDEINNGPDLTEEGDHYFSDFLKARETLGIARYLLPDDLPQELI